MLDSFYEKIRPNGLWGPVAKRTGIPIEKGAMMRNWITWIWGCSFILTGLMGTGLVILGSMEIGVPLLIVAAVSFGILYHIIRESS